MKFGVNLTFFAPWSPWQRPPLIFFSTSPTKLPHTTVRSMKEIKKSPTFFLFPWQLRQSLSYRFRFFWLISFHYMWMRQETLNIFCTLVNMATATVLNFFQPPKSCHTLQSFMKFDERNPFFFLNPPFFDSMATAAKFVQTITIFFGLSRSTRCGCCSYQVSSISVWRVICYDHFCVFHFNKHFGRFHGNGSLNGSHFEKINP